jgi:hypothetical protein
MNRLRSIDAQSHRSSSRPLLGRVQSYAQEKASLVAHMCPSLEGVLELCKLVETDLYQSDLGKLLL